MICPKADKCLRVCEAKFEHERSHFCEEECGAGYIAPCNIILEKPVDVTLQDFNALMKTRGTNKAVIQSNIMRQVMEIAPLLAQAYESLQGNQTYARPMPKLPPLPKPARHPWGF